MQFFLLTNRGRIDVVGLFINAVSGLSSAPKNKMAESYRVVLYSNVIADATSRSVAVVTANHLSAPQISRRPRLSFYDNGD